MENNNIAEQTNKVVLENNNNFLNINFSELSKFYYILHWIVILILSYFSLNSVINIFWYLKDYISGYTSFINVLSGAFISFYTLVIFYLVLKKRYFGYIATMFLNIISLTVMFNALFIERDLFGSLNLKSIIINLLISFILTIVSALFMFIYIKNNKNEAKKILLTSKESSEITKNNENILSPSWFLILFLFLHFSAFVLSYGGLATSLIKNDDVSMFLELIISMLAWFSIFGIYKNKIWGYVSTIFVLIASGVIAFIFRVLAGWGGVSGWNIYFYNYLFFIHPFLLLIAFILSIRMIFRLYKQRNNN